MVDARKSLEAQAFAVADTGSVQQNRSSYRSVSSSSSGTRLFLVSCHSGKPVGFPDWACIPKHRGRRSYRLNPAQTAVKRSPTPAPSQLSPRQPKLLSAPLNYRHRHRQPCFAQPRSAAPARKSGLIFPPCVSVCVVPCRCLRDASPRPLRPALRITAVPPTAHECSNYRGSQEDVTNSRLA
jgi:hypothetical protein